MDGAFLLTTALLMPGSFYLGIQWGRRLFRNPKPKKEETVIKCAKLSIVRMPCGICHGGLEDGDLVIWTETGHKSTATAHASCAVLRRAPDGVITRLLNGEKITTPPEGAIVIDEAAWKIFEVQGGGEMRVVERPIERGEV